jgi:hypothetical protein
MRCEGGFLGSSRLGFQPIQPTPSSDRAEESEWSVSFMAPHLDSESSDSEDEDSSALLGVHHPLGGQVYVRPLP